MFVPVCPGCPFFVFLYMESAHSWQNYRCQGLFFSVGVKPQANIFLLMVQKKKPLQRKTGGIFTVILKDVPSFSVLMMVVESVVCCLTWSKICVQMGSDLSAAQATAYHQATALIMFFHSFDQVFPFIRHPSIFQWRLLTAWFVESKQGHCFLKLTLLLTFSNVIFKCCKQHKLNSIHLYWTWTRQKTQNLGTWSRTCLNDYIPASPGENVNLCQDIL